MDTTSTDLCDSCRMSDLKFKKGTYGKEDVRTDVERIRVMSDPWVVDGIELISITVDFSNGSSEDLSAIQTNYELT